MCALRYLAHEVPQKALCIAYVQSYMDSVHVPYVKSSVSSVKGHVRDPVSSLTLLLTSIIYLQSFIILRV